MIEGQPVSIEEIIAVAKEAEPRLTTIAAGVVAKLQ